MQLEIKHSLPPAYKNQKKTVRLKTERTKQKEEEISKGNNVRICSNVDNAQEAYQCTIKL